MNIFDPKHKKRVKMIFGVVSVLVILSMIILYSGFVALGNGSNNTTTRTIDASDIQVDSVQSVTIEE